MVSARTTVVSISRNKSEGCITPPDQGLSVSALNGDSVKKPAWVAVTESIANRPMTNSSARTRFNRSIFIKPSCARLVLCIYKHIECRLL